MTISRKVILTLTPDEKRALDQAQRVLANIAQLIEKDKEEESLYDLYRAADEAYTMVGTVYNYTEEDYT